MRLVKAGLNTLSCFSNPAPVQDYQKFPSCVRLEDEVPHLLSILLKQLTSLEPLFESLTLLDGISYGTR